MGAKSRVGVKNLTSSGRNFDDLMEMTFRQVRARQIGRDQVFRYSRTKVMENTCSDLGEWITQEIKDLLIVLEIFKVKGNRNIKAEMNDCEKRVREIQHTFPRQVIAPMKKIAKGSSGAKNEEEYARRFRSALDTAFGVVLELRKIREKTESAYRAMS
jgi:gamma-glutamylcysteine synthetase